VAASLTPRIDALDGDDSNAGPAVAGPSTEETSMLTTVLLGLLQTTWVVDAAAGPGSHFTDLPAAIAAAADGDTILVRAGSYSAFTITAKELAIRGAGVGITIVNGPSQLVLSTPTSGINLFSGMTMHGYLWATNGAKVTLLDCEILGTDAAATGSGALIVSQAEVFALRCRFTGGDAVGPPPSPPFGGAMQGGPAVTVQGGKFGAHDCDITGGSIAGTFAGQGGRNGGWGLAVLDFATARIDSCSIVGGNGSLPISFTSFGGDGVFVRNTSRLQIDNTPADIVASGLGSPLGGAAAIRLTNERFYGPSEVIVHGTLTTTGTIVGPVTLGAPDLPPLTVAATTLPTGETDASQPVNVTFDGLFPSAPFALMLGFRPSYGSAQPPLLGDLLLDPASAAFLTGQLDPAGLLQFSFVPAGIFGGAVPFPFYMQCAVFDPSGDIRLSNLDARFYSL
jgi:hypothetical protein